MLFVNILYIVVAKSLGHLDRDVFTYY